MTSALPRKAALVICSIGISVDGVGKLAAILAHAAEIAGIWEQRAIG